MSEIQTLQQSDSLSAFAAGTAYDGPQTIRERDMTMPQYAKSPKQPDPETEYHLWDNERGEHGRPKTFQPNGSFSALRLAGKLADASTEMGSQSRQIMKEKKYFMPGYTGFVRGSQHISGRTFGEMSRRAFDTDYREHLCTSPIPSAPQANRKVEHYMPPESFMTHITGGDKSIKHVPGYTGHVPGVRQVYSKTFGESTAQEMKEFLKEHPRSHPQEAPSMAATSRPRQMLHIDSSPLPGGTKLEEAPDKLVPAHLKYLRFFPL